ncbi:uncharacterized protein majin [Neosynchiropus ocellatus]
MSQVSFGFPHDVTRFYEAGSFIYMFKFKGGSCFRQGVYSSYFDLIEIIRTVLGNLQNLRPFSSTHFNVFPYEERWQGASHVLCHNAHNNLKPYPYVLILYLEENKACVILNIISVKQPGQKRGGVSGKVSHAGELTLHDRVRTLEDAVLQDMMDDLVAESGDAEMGCRANTPHTLKPFAKNSPDLVDEEDSLSENNQTPGFGCTTEEGVDSSEEEETEEDQNNTRPGFWRRLFQNIFPFSLFLRDA